MVGCGGKGGRDRGGGKGEGEVGGEAEQGQTKQKESNRNTCESASPEGLVVSCFRFPFCFGCGGLFSPRLILLLNWLVSWFLRAHARTLAHTQRTHNRPHCSRPVCVRTLDFLHSSLPCSTRPKTRPLPAPRTKTKKNHKPARPHTHTHKFKNVDLRRRRRRSPGLFSPAPSTHLPSAKNVQPRGDGRDRSIDRSPCMEKIDVVNKTRTFGYYLV